MSTAHFLNIMKMQAALVNNGTALTTLGAIAQYDSTSHYAIAELYSADSSDNTIGSVQTPWLPIFSPWVGNGWGLFAPPSIGDIVEIHYVEGSLQNGYIGLRTWSPNSGATPLNVNSGEFWLVHQSGSYIKMLNSGDININVATASNVNITAATGHVNITSATQVNLTAANISLGGAVSLGNLAGTLLGFLNGNAAGVYNTHTHGDPQGGTTGVPNQLMNATVITSNVLGN
jgi:hypothetical protein